MKRVLSVVVALMIFGAMTVNAFALGFVPSIEVKNAPGLSLYTEDGEEIFGKIVDAEGKVVSIEKDGCIIVTPVADAYDQESGIKEDVKKALISAYEDIKKNGTKALEGLVDKGLAVRDLFAVSSDCADLLKYLPVEGNKLDLKFDLKLGKEEKIQAVIYVDGAWKKLPVVNNGDGTVTVTFEELGVVAFLGKTTGESPDTGDHSGAELVIWISLMAVSAIAIVALLVLVHRKKTDK